ncbi:MAG: biotin/lipoyl-containing protein, partial [Crocinitomicaceae bacterium]
MAEIEIRLPKMGESVTEATITNWLKNIGDAVAIDEPLVEVATDKVDNELPSEAAGTLIKILFEKDQVAQVGDVIAILSTDGAGATSAPAAAPSNNTAPAPTQAAAAPTSTPEAQAPAAIKSNDGRFYSPLVRTIAQKENISAAELAQIAGSGQEGRVTKKDVLAFLDTRQAPVAQTTSNTTPAASAASTPAASSTGIQIKEPVVIANAGDEIIEMDRMRK